MHSVQETAASGQAHLLLVDDDARLLQVMASALESCGYHVLALADGTQAHEIVEREGTDLVLLDVEMPSLSGLEVGRRIKRSDRGRLVPVVLLTRSAPDDVIAGLDAGADDFLTKPIGLRVLAARIKDAQQEAAGARLSVSRREHIAMQVRQLAGRGALSAREAQVLDLLLIGRTMADIGLVLGISARTAKFHQANVLEKLGAESRHDWRAAMARRVYKCPTLAFRFGRVHLSQRTGVRPLCLC